MLPTTKPDKKVPTHGPGTTAWYRGKEAKILAIENGKAKIFCDGRVLLVNYTSLDDASFKTLHETYRVVDCDSHKALYTGTKEEYESFISDECQDKETKVVELKEAIMVPSDAMDKDQTLGDLVADLRGNVAAQFASNPVLNGIATLQRNYVPVWDYDYETETENKAFKKLDKDIRSKFRKILSIPGSGGSQYEVYANKDNTSYLLYFSDMGAKGWYVPAAGKINESEAQDKYQEFFKKKLADYGVSSPAELSAEDKSKFFSEIKKEWPDAKVNESIAIPADYQYPMDIADEIGLEGKELALAKKYLGNTAILLPTYDPDEGKEVKEGLKLKALLPKAKILGTVGGGRQGGVIAYKFPKGTVAIYVESEYEDPYFLLKPTKSINEAAQNKALFAKVYKWYNALAFDPKSILFYNLFRFSSAGERIAKKYKTLSQFVKLGSKIVSESGSYKLTGFGIVNAIVAYYSTFKKEADIAARLASIKMDNSKDYLKYHELAKSTSLNEGVDPGMAFGIGSTVNYNGKTCKVVSIANGKCKLVCSGEVLYANMDQLKPSTSVNEKKLEF